MPTRREFLTALALAPFVVHLTAAQSADARGVEIWLEHHCLSLESAMGFKHLVSRYPSATSFASGRTASGSLIIAPGIRWMSLSTAADLAELINEGASVILESGLGFSSRTESKHQIDLLKKVFGLQLLPPVKVGKNPAAATYVEYTRPVHRLVRTFEAITPIACDQSEALARLGKYSVCIRKKIGDGTLVFLGSMLGPGIAAEEREAIEVASALVTSDSESIFNSKRTDFPIYAQPDLDKVAWRLNQRPRKTLGFETPASRLRATVVSTH